MNPQYEVRVLLWLDGELADDLAGQVRFVEVHEHSEQASTFRVGLALGATPEDDWDLLKDGRLTLLRRVTVGLRLTPVGEDTVTAEANLLDGYVTVVEPDLSPSRYSRATLVIEGLDTLCAMHLDERTRTWNDTSDAEIARKVFDEYGLAADVEADSPRRVLDRASFVQRCTDAELLRVLARRNGFCLYAEPKDGEVRKGASAKDDVVGHFHLPRLNAPEQTAISLHPSETPQVIDFRARWTSHAPTVVRASHVDERTRRLETKEIKATRLPSQGSHSRAALLGARLPDVLPTRPNVEAVGRAVRDVPHDARDLDAITWADYLAADWLAEAKGVVNGLRYPGILRARRPLGVTQAGTILNGPWWVRSARHRILWDAVPRRYEVEVDLVRNALGGVA